MSFISAIRQGLSSALKSKPSSPPQNTARLQGRQFSSLPAGPLSPRSPKSPTSPKVLLGKGATSHTAPGLIARGLEKDYRVVACARNVDKAVAKAVTPSKVT